MIDIFTLTRNVRAFTNMMADRNGHLLDEYVTAGQASALPQLASFARGLTGGYEAVRNGLALPYSSAAVEGKADEIIMWNLICQAVPRLACCGNRWRIEQMVGRLACCEHGYLRFRAVFPGRDRCGSGGAWITPGGSRWQAAGGVRPLRFAEDGDWFANCPVVLDFDGFRVELCHWKLDELSIGWDTIDTGEAIGGWDWVEFTPVWSRSDERLEPFVGRELREVAFLEWRPSGRDLAAGTVAVEFAFDTGGFRVANGLDENCIEVGVAQPEYVRHRLGR